MSHPQEMLSDYQLENFREFIRKNPNGPKVEGAFDSVPNRKYRGRSIPLHEFERGGAYDYQFRRERLARLARDETEPPVGAASTDLESFAKIAVKFARDMSPEEWMGIYEKCRSDGAVDDMNSSEKDLPKAMDAAFAGCRIDTMGMQPRPKAQRITADAAASFAALFPGAIHGCR